MSKRNIVIISTVTVFAALIMLVGLRNPTTAALANGGSTFTTHLPIIVNNAAPVPYPIFFGTQVYGSTTPATTFHDSLIESRAQTVRNFVAWRNVEPEDTDPSNYDWTNTDNRMYIARKDASGLATVLTVEGNPDWAAPGIHTALNDDAYDDFAEFITALVERYDGDGIADAPGSPVITYLELYNEPDRNSNAPNNGGHWGNDPDKYARMLATAYTSAKMASPSVKVAFGGIAYDFNTAPSDPFVKSFFPEVLNNLRDGNYS